jgi:hypothetical protein
MVGNVEGERPLGRPRSRWKDNIRTDLRVIGWEVCGLDSSVSGKGPVVWSSEHGNGPLGSINGEEFLDYETLRKDSAPCGWLVGWLVG